MACPNCGANNKVSINGKNYCADCGEPLTAIAQAKPAKPVAQPAAAVAPKARPEPPQHQSARHVLDLSGSAKVKPKPAHRQPAQLAARKHRPAQSIHGVRRQTSVATKTRPKKAAAAPTQAVQAPVQRQAQRHQQASRIGRSNKISKFSPSLKQIAKTEKPEPAPEPVPLTPHQTYQVNPKIARANQAAAMAMQHSRYVQPAAAPTTAPAAAKKVKRRRNPFKKLAQLFQARPRLATVSAIAAIVLVLGSYITYLNYPNIALRVAAGRAGIDASMPHYTPSGYSFRGPVNYGPGQLTVRFTSNSDAGFITLNQQKTDWDSASLLENYVLDRTDKYLTFQENGLTIYMYNGNNAAWVNQGIFYSLEGNNYLNSEQILKIATSL